MKILLLSCLSMTLHGAVVVMTPPVCHQPVYQQPVYQPMYQQPVYQQPVYQVPQQQFVMINGVMYPVNNQPLINQTPVIVYPQQQVQVIVERPLISIGGVPIVTVETRH